MYRTRGVIYRISYEDRSRIAWLRQLPDNRVQLHASGSALPAYVLQASTNLLDWQPVATNILSAAEFDVYDVVPPGSPQRFYRLAE